MKLKYLFILTFMLTSCCSSEKPSTGDQFIPAGDLQATDLSVRIPPTKKIEIILPTVPYAR
jgi:hypothetical protein